ncbi:MAG: hypothetical protein ABIN94_03360 [Ferruginibacter sp.]
MKHFIIAVFCLASLTTSGQTEKVAFDGNKWEAPYTLGSPKGWDVERFAIPIEFAPQIPYTGIEDVRFTPGWGKAETNEYWSYAFLWYLDGTIETHAKTVENNLKAYYTGLVGRNIEPRKIPASKLVPVKTKFKEVKTNPGDLKTFNGTIYMLDYMEQKPITLNCIVHVKSCTGQNKTFIFNEISPKLYSDNVWQSLNKLWIDFRCDKVADIK